MALKHGPVSAGGFVRLLLTRPAFAARLFGRRLNYFVFRRFHPPFITPDGFPIETRDALITYWSVFVERELWDSSWVGALQASSHPLVVDVGANAGVFSHFVQTLKRDAEIIAFEPLPAMARRLERLPETTGVHLTCIQKAVTASAGHAWFESTHGDDGTSHLAISPATEAKQRFRVETTTLDAVLRGRKPFLVKIDVEGFECDVIAGAKQAVADAQFLIIEAHTEADLQAVSEAVGQGWSTRRLGSSDYLFFRSR